MDRLRWIEEGFGLNQERLEDLLQILANMDSEDLSHLEQSLKKKRNK